MAKTLAELCVPRTTVFETARADTVLTIRDLVEGNIKADEFFNENYVTEGMRTLLTQGFQRLSGRSAQGVFLLRQAMGGGKTHNLLTFGLLAKHADQRARFAEDLQGSANGLGDVKVIAFNGRETDTEFGIWGALAKQMGNLEHFKDNYSPFRAPGQSAWENLFAGETVLILIDELPPYLFSANSVGVGQSTLADVTTTAITNLLSALTSDACSRVCLVITDLNGSYEFETARISRVLGILSNEANRTAQSLEPVNMGSNELYHILRKRIFETLPNQSEISEVAQAYAAELRKARQMNLVEEDPESFLLQIESSYPFHPAIRDLYARFKENPGFQQTRGLIRLARLMVARLYAQENDAKLARQRYLIGAHDLDFNDATTRGEITQINNTLTNAIAHDIAKDGDGIAEKLDRLYGNTDASDVCRLILMSSLANVENGVHGLTLAEVTTYIAAPGRNLQHLRTTLLERLSVEAWYLHSDQDGKLFFKNTENLVAKIESLVSIYDVDQAIKELRERLRQLFAPTQGWAYQKMEILPALDEIKLEPDKVSLVILEPQPSGGIHPDVAKFWEEQTYRNRVAFLTGTNSTYTTIIDNGKRLKAVARVLDDYRVERRGDNDPLMVAARDMADRYQNNFLSSVRDTFNIVFFPWVDGDQQPILEQATISMLFTANHYNGEQQIIDLLISKGKFEQNVSDKNFREKIEARIFNAKSMQWSEVLRRAAINCKWNWHIPSALDAMRTESVQRGIWRENNGYVEKGPFERDKTSIRARVISRADDSGEVELEISPVHGDSVFIEKGAPATQASYRLEGRVYKTSAFHLSLLAIDSETDPNSRHETGPAVDWFNEITLKRKFHQEGPNLVCTLQVAPAGAVIRYSTDHSNPATSAVYNGPFQVPPGCTLVKVIAEKDIPGLETRRSQEYNWQPEWPPSDPGNPTPQPPVPDPDRPASWRRVFERDDTQATYTFLEAAKRNKATISDLSLIIGSNTRFTDWIEVSFEPGLKADPQQVMELLASMRPMLEDAKFSLKAGRLHFANGGYMIDMIADLGLILQYGELEQ